MSATLAIAVLIEAGAKNEKKEDRASFTREGWWMDDCWLGPASDPEAALAALRAKKMYHLCILAEPVIPIDSPEDITDAQALIRNRDLYLEGITNKAWMPVEAPKAWMPVEAPKAKPNDDLAAALQSIGYNKSTSKKLATDYGHLDVAVAITEIMRDAI